MKTATAAERQNKGNRMQRTTFQVSMPPVDSGIVSDIVVGDVPTVGDGEGLTAVSECDSVVEEAGVGVGAGDDGMLKKTPPVIEMLKSDRVLETDETLGSALKNVLAWMLAIMKCGSM